MTLDIEAIRAEFPILDIEHSSGNPFVYLDSAATTQKPVCVLEAMDSYYRKTNANVHRAVYSLAAEATAGYEAARSSLAAFFGTDREEFVFTSGTTEAINLVAYAWARTALGPGDVILTTEMEHHSDIVPWQLLSKERGVEIRYVPLLRDSMTLDMEAFEVGVEEAAMVCAVHTSNVLGVRNDVERIVELAKSRGRGPAGRESTQKGENGGAVVLLDCAQAAPHERLNFAEMGADFIAISGHKMGGPTGIGGLVATREMLASMQPFISGGDMIEKVTLEGSTFQSGPQRFEAGTPKIAEAFGWAAAIKWLEQFDMKEVHAHISNLARHTANGIRTLPGIEIQGRHDLKSASGIVSFTHETLHAEDIAHLMDAGGFALRTGHHCAQPLLAALGISSTVRASFWIHNTMQEADALIAHLAEIIQRFG